MNITTNTLIRILVFKTNIRSKEDLLLIAATINELPGIQRWNVDQHDIDNVLRIESEIITADYIIDTVKMLGYQCEELPD